MNNEGTSMTRERLFDTVMAVGIIAAVAYGICASVTAQPPLQPRLPDTITPRQTVAEFQGGPRLAIREATRKYESWVVVANQNGRDCYVAIFHERTNDATDQLEAVRTEIVLTPAQAREVASALTRFGNR